MPELASAIDEAEASKTQTEEDLKKAQMDRSAAKAAMAEATAIREKEAAAFATLDSELKTNIAAIGKAVAALEKGAGGSFLQTDAANILRKIVESKQDMLDIDREDLTAFLSGGSSYAPQSGAITGILKQMGDTMSADLGDATKVENDAIATYDQLMSADLGDATKVENDAI